MEARCWRVRSDIAEQRTYISKTRVKHRRGGRNVTSGHKLIVLFTCTIKQSKNKESMWSNPCIVPFPCYPRVWGINWGLPLTWLFAWSVCLAPAIIRMSSLNNPFPFLTHLVDMFRCQSGQTNRILLYPTILSGWRSKDPGYKGNDGPVAHVRPTEPSDSSDNIAEDEPD